MRYQGDTTQKHGFESASTAEEDRGQQAGSLLTNLREVAVVTTADKEHIQQMTTQNDNLLRVVRKQQTQIDKQQTHIDEMMKHNGHLTNKMGTNTNNNTGGATNGGSGNTHRGRYRGNRNTNGNGNRDTNSNDTGSDAGAGTNNRNDNRPKCAVCPLRLYVTADCRELDKNKDKRHDNWASLLE